MSYVRIQEWRRRPARRGDATWYRVEASRTLVSVATSSDVPPVAAGPADVISDWVGVLGFASGSGRRGSMAYLLKYPVPDAFRWEFEAWFEYEHMPLLHEEPTWHSCRFFHALRPSSYSHAAIHDLEPGALTSAARDRSIATPWWHRLKAHDWFDKGFVRMRLHPL